jgi:hypothetical protein
MSNKSLAFLKQWESDPYAIARTAALSWLGDRYLLAQPINQQKRKIVSESIENKAPVAARA